MSLTTDAAGRRLLDEAAARCRETAPERWRKVSDAAAVCARYLACHPMVTWVRYPGLPTDPCYRMASTTLVGGFGPTIAYGLVDGASVLLTCAAVDPLDLVATLEASLPDPRPIQGSTSVDGCVGGEGTRV